METDTAATHVFLYLANAKPKAPHPVDPKYQYGVVLSQGSVKVARHYFKLRRDLKLSKEKAWRTISPLLASNGEEGERFNKLTANMLDKYLSMQDENSPLIYRQTKTRVLDYPHIMVMNYVKQVEETDTSKVEVYKETIHPLIREAGDAMIEWIQAGRPPLTASAESSPESVLLIKLIGDQSKELEMVHKQARKDSNEARKQVFGTAQKSMSMADRALSKLDGARKDAQEDAADVRKNLFAQSDRIMSIAEQVRQDTREDAKEIADLTKYRLSNPDGSPLRKQKAENTKLVKQLTEANTQIEEMNNENAKLLAAFRKTDTWFFKGLAEYMKEEVDSLNRYMIAQNEKVGMGDAKVHAVLKTLKKHKKVMSAKMEQAEKQIESLQKELTAAFDAFKKVLEAENFHYEAESLI